MAAESQKEVLTALGRALFPAALMVRQAASREGGVSGSSQTSNPSDFFPTGLPPREELGLHITESGCMLAFWLGFICLVVIKTQKHQQDGQQMLLAGGVGGVGARGRSQYFASER